MLKAILFDLDHTLIDWDQSIPWDTFNHDRLGAVLDYLRAQGHTTNGASAETLLEAFITELTAAWDTSRETFNAPSLYSVVYNTLMRAGIASEHIDIETVMQVYNWQPHEGERAYPDALDVLPQLAEHGLAMGIVTNASQPMHYRDRELQAFGLCEWFPDCRVSAADVGYIKPHRAIFEHALEILNVQPDEAVFVGDSLEADIQGAQGIGMRGVWRERINQHNDQYAETIVPDGTITTLHDLPPLLDRWFPGWRNGQAR